jgi:ABC-type amino acid transport substrate-binding protein
MAASRIPGMKLEFTYGTMTELQEALRTGRIDMIVNNVAKTPAREEEFIFADRGYVFVETFLVVHNDDARTSLDQFDGAVMGGLGPANFFYRWLDEYNTENNNLFSEIRIYENYQELFMDIDLGRIDGTLCDAPIVMFNAQALNLDIKCVGEILDSAYSFFMIRNDDQGRRLKGEIDRVMTDIVNDGSLLALSMEWFGEDMTREK